MYAPRYAPPGVASPYHLFQAVCAGRTFAPPERATPTRVHRPPLSATARGASREHSTQARQNPQRHSSQRPHQRRLAARGNRATAPHPTPQQTDTSHRIRPRHPAPQIVGPQGTPLAA